MLNRGTLLGIFLISFLVIITSWYAAKMSIIMPFTGASLTSIGTLQHGVIVQMNDQGVPQYKGTVVQASENGASDISLTGLQWEDYSQAVPWTLTAASGMLSDQNTQLQLGGGVNLSRPATPNNPAILVQTDQARVDVEAQTIMGSDLITVSQPGTLNQVRAVGFVAQIPARTLRFLTEVQSVYQPPAH